MKRHRLNLQASNRDGLRSVQLHAYVWPGAGVVVSALQSRL